MAATAYGMFRPTPPEEKGRLVVRVAVYLLFLCCGLSVSSAHGEDGASLHVFGFSHDGRYFAFEQSVTEDASVADVDEIFVTDTETDTWATGTPIRVRIEDDNQRPGVSAKALARAKAREIFQNPGIEMVAPRPIARNAAIHAGEEFGPTEVRGVWARSAKQLVVSDPMLGGTIKLFVTDKVIAVPKASCEKTGREAVPIPEGFATGFKLDMADKGFRHLHEDDTLPKSRGYCPFDYGIAEVYLRHGTGGRAVLVVVMDYYLQGWEGPDRRFLAVSAKLPLQGSQGE